MPSQYLAEMFTKLNDVFTYSYSGGAISGERQCVTTYHYVCARRSYYEEESDRFEGYCRLDADIHNRRKHFGCKFPDLVSEVPQAERSDDEIHVGSKSHVLDLDK